MSDFEKSFDKLMEEVEILRAHFDYVDRKAERLMVKFRRAKDRTSFDKIVAYRKTNWKNFEKAIDLISTQITKPESMRRGRKEIMAMKGVAWDFVKRLREVEATLDDIAAAANVIRDFTTTLGRVL